MTKDKITKEICLDKQTTDTSNCISSINSVDKIKECLLKAFDGITSNIKEDIVGVSWFAVKIDITNHCVSTDADFTYLRLETDSEQEARLRFADSLESESLLSLRLQAKRFGYKLEKIK